jgi:hypothetical protein
MPRIPGKQLRDNTVTATQADTTDGYISIIEAGDGVLEGTGQGLARRDHQHEVATGGATDDIAAGNVAAEGLSGNLAREDHAHAVDTTNGAISSIDAGDSAAEGSGTGLARRDHQHAVSTGGSTDQIDADNSAAEGTSTNLAREDHVHAIDTTGTLSTINAGDAAVGGSATGLSRKDHQHAVATATAGAIQIGDAAAEGASSSLSRADHTHSLAAPAAPADVTKAAASAGSATAPARADHKHDISTGAPVNVGLANVEGTSTALARADHVHAISVGAKQDLLNSKRFAFGVQTNDFTASSSTSDTGNTLTKEIVDASASKLTGGSGSVSGIVTSGADNRVSIRDGYFNDPIEDLFNRQVFGRLTETINTPSGTWTWNGTTTVTTGDTSGVVVGNFIRLSATDPLFEITVINTNVDVTITNPGGLTIPSGSGIQEVPLTLSYLVDNGGVEQAHTMAGEDIDLVFRESLGLNDAPFNSLQSGTAFSEILPATHTHTLSDVTDITANAGEINTLDGFTGTTAELNEITDGSDVANATHHHDSTYPRSDILTTKGDVYVRTASGIVRLGVGTDGQVLTAASAQTEGVEWQSTAVTDTERQEDVTTQTIINNDTALTDTLDFVPKADLSLKLFLNGILQDQGAGRDYTVSSQTITWLASSGTAVNLQTNDTLTAVYVS